MTTDSIDDEETSLVAHAINAVTLETSSSNSSSSDSNSKSSPNRTPQEDNRGGATATPTPPKNRRTTPSRRKLKVLVITGGGARQQQIEHVFAQRGMVEHFTKPTFSPGVTSRSLRNRYNLLHLANECGLLPAHEWDALSPTIQRHQQQQQQQERPHYDEEDQQKQSHTDKNHQQQQQQQQQQQNLFACLEGVPVVTAGRIFGPPHAGVPLHYSVELWRKAKALNRDRSVLACLFAHLMAMRTFFGVTTTCTSNSSTTTTATANPSPCFDLIIEDNVRADPSNCAQQVWEAIDSLKEWEKATQEQQPNPQQPQTCQLLLYGWLGSTTNLRWIMDTHIPKRKFQRRRRTRGGRDEADHGTTSTNAKEDTKKDDVTTESAVAATTSTTTTTVPYPRFDHLADDFPGLTTDEDDSTVQATKDKTRKPGGNLLWGAYAYWISYEGYQNVLTALRNDVGAIVWKGKRQRYYKVKPIDKILPRQILRCATASASTAIDSPKKKTATDSANAAVRIVSAPCFFRAPMLTSQIHTKWDPSFCDSTEYQLQYTTNTKNRNKNEDDAANKDETTNPWSELWLTETERKIIEHHQSTGNWLTVRELALQQHKLLPSS